MDVETTQCYPDLFFKKEFEVVRKCKLQKHLDNPLTLRILKISCFHVVRSE